MASVTLTVASLVGLVFLIPVLATPEQGKWIFNMDQDYQFRAVSKHIYKGSKVKVTVSLKCDVPPDDVEISWLLRMSPCAMEFVTATGQINSNDPQNRVAVEEYMVFPRMENNLLYDQVEWVNGSSTHSCSEQEFKLEGPRNQTVRTFKPPAKKPSSPKNPNKPNHPDVATVWVDGNYLFVLHIRPKGETTKFKAQVTIRTFFGDENYISAMDYPLLIFYGLMGLVYIGYGLVWLVLLACNWRDLLRVQFWIGGVILLGMLEEAVFFAEYETLNKTGQSVRGAVIFAELVSSLRRALARMLVIIISLGPRLGQTFHKVLFVGGLYFILASIEGCMRATSSKVDQSNQFLLAAVPLAVLEVIICGWIILSLIRTMRTLRLKNDVVKLTVYRYFTYILTFVVLVSVACFVWSMTQHKFKECIKDWKQLWIDEAFWHMLFVILLLIIMLLWRPTANNQRYAFSPLLDAADEEDDEDALMNDALDGMKENGVRPSSGSLKPPDPNPGSTDFVTADHAESGP